MRDKSTLTIDDIKEAQLKMNKMKDETVRPIINAFEGADYDRGDTVFISTKVMSQRDIPGILKDRVFASPLLEANEFLVIQGDNMEKFPDFISTLNYPVLHPNGLKTVVTT